MRNADDLRSAAVVPDGVVLGDRCALDLDRPRIAVVIATLGRGPTLPKTIALLDAQTRRPDLVVVSASSREDVGELEAGPRLDIVYGAVGLAGQRNRALRRLPSTIEIVVFFDDDFVPHPRWIEVVARCFDERPRVVAVTGHVVADGVKGPGLSFRDALEAIDRDARDDIDVTVEGYSPYGCNMAFRRAAIEDLYFDERLVLYGWLEDRDFGGALAKRGGVLLKLGAAIGVHLGIKSGRPSGRRLGYSQVVNPVYLRRKGTMSTACLVDHVARNVAANLVKSFRPEPHIDRRGRLAGNARAIFDLVVGSATPERAQTF